jgi:hypothetical protein
MLAVGDRDGEIDFLNFPITESLGLGYSDCMLFNLILS